MRRPVRRRPRPCSVGGGAPSQAGTKVAQCGARGGTDGGHCAPDLVDGGLIALLLLPSPPSGARDRASPPRGGAQARPRLGGRAATRDALHAMADVDAATTSAQYCSSLARSKRSRRSVYASLAGCLCLGVHTHLLRHRSPRVWWLMARCGCGDGAGRRGDCQKQL